MYKLFNKKSKKQKKKNSKKSNIIFLGIIILAILFLIFQPKYGFFSIYLLHKKNAQMEKDLIETKARIILLQHKIDRLKTDKFYIEKNIREKTGMIKRGEKIIINKE